MTREKILLERVNGEIISNQKLNNISGGSWNWSKFWNNATCAVGSAGKIAGASTGSTATCGR